jgi:hypothetical protein
MPPRVSAAVWLVGMPGPGDLAVEIARCRTLPEAELFDAACRDHGPAVRELLERQLERDGLLRYAFAAPTGSRRRHGERNLTVGMARQVAESLAAGCDSAASTLRGEVLARWAAASVLAERLGQPWSAALAEAIDQARGWDALYRALTTGSSSRELVGTPWQAVSDWVHAAEANDPELPHLELGPRPTRSDPPDRIRALLAGIGRARTASLDRALSILDHVPLAPAQAPPSVRALPPLPLEPVPPSPQTFRVSRPRVSKPPGFASAGLGMLGLCASTWLWVWASTTTLVVYNGGDRTVEVTLDGERFEVAPHVAWRGERWGVPRASGVATSGGRVEDAAEIHFTGLRETWVWNVAGLGWLEERDVRWVKVGYEPRTTQVHGSAPIFRTSADSLFSPAPDPLPKSSNEWIALVSVAPPPDATSPAP